MMSAPAADFQNNPVGVRSCPGIEQLVSSSLKTSSQPGILPFHEILAHLVPDGQIPVGGLPTH